MDDEAPLPLIERYRVVIGLLWTQTENLDRLAKSMGLLLEMVPDRGRKVRKLKNDLRPLIEAAIEANSPVFELLRDVGISAQEEGEVR